MGGIKEEEMKERVYSMDGTEIRLGRRLSRLEMFRDIMNVVKRRSSCNRNQVASLIVKDNRIISVGYNGPPAGFTEYWCELECFDRMYVDDMRSRKNCDCRLGSDCNISIHAEMNALIFAARNGLSVLDCIMYVSVAPCINCAKILAQSGIKRVVFDDWYRDKAGIAFLLECEIEVKRYVEVEGVSGNLKLDEVNMSRTEREEYLYGKKN